MSTLIPSLRGAIAVPGWAKNELWRRARALPSLDLRFAENKSLVDARTGSNLVTFTRASTGTYVGADGLIKTAAVNEARFDHNPTTGESLGLLVEEQRTNLCLQSEVFGATTWSVGGSAVITDNQGTAPNGALTADLLTTPSGGANRLLQAGLATTSTTYTASIYVKAGSINGLTFRLFFSGGTTIDTYADFIFASGTFTAANGVGTFTAQNVGGGWFRIVCTVGSGNNTAWEMRIGGLITTAQTGTTALLWGAQLEAGAFPTSYIPTLPTFVSRASTATFFDANGVIQTAGVNVARDNAFAPDSNGVMRPIGLLAEEQRTNLNTNSEAFDTYTASAGSVSANQGVAPNGTLTADEITSTGGGVFKSISGTTASTAYTVSVFAKYISGGGIFSFGFDANPSSGRADFDLQAGALGGVVGANVTSRSITPYGNGWYRCSVTATVTSTSTIVVFYSATSGAKWLCWGAQLEAGAFPTSYIPTLPTFVSRASTATFFDANGVIQTAGVNVARDNAFAPDSNGVMRPIGLLVEEQRTNLCLQSEAVDTSSWSIAGSAVITANQGIAPNGTLTADLLTTSSGGPNRLLQAGLATTSTTYTASIYVKAGSINGLTFRLFFSGGTTIDTYADFIFASGTFTAANGVGTFTAQNVGGGWFRIACTAASGNNTAWEMRIGGLITTTQIGTTALLWGAQLEAGAFPTSYIPTLPTFVSRASTATFFDASGVLQTAGVNVARSNAFLPDSSGVMRSIGLLAEEARTNSIRNNTMVGAVAGTPGTLPTNWNAASALTGLTQQIVGTGTESGISYIDIRLFGTPSSSGTYRYYLENPAAIAALTGQTWVNSYYIKLAGGSLAGISTFTDIYQEFTSSGVYVTEGGVSAITPTSALLVTQRNITTRTLAGGATVALLRTGIQLSLTGTAIDITLRIGMPQLEQGAFATSVIPTSGTAATRSADVTNIAAVTRSADVTNIATATRSADVASITGAAFSSWYRQDEGTVFVDILRGYSGNFPGYPNILSFNDGTGNNLIVLYGIQNTQNITNFSIQSGGVGQTDFVQAGSNVPGPNRIGQATAANSSIFAVNGTLTAQDSTVTMPNGNNRMVIGSDRFFVAQWGGTIRRLTYWPARLANSTLQSITA